VPPFITFALISIIIPAGTVILGAILLAHICRNGNKAPENTIDDEHFNAWAAVDHDGDECISNFRMVRASTGWVCQDLNYDPAYVPRGTIKRLLGHNLEWGDEPVLLTRQDK